MKLRRCILVVGLILCWRILTAQQYFDISLPDFNTRSKEFAPAFFMNGLVFCSDRRIDFFMSYTDYNNNLITNLFYAGKKKHGNFEIPKLMAKELTTNFFDGPSSFSRDGKEVYFTRTIDVSGRSRNRNRGDTTFGIFISRWVNGEWSEPVPFEYNSLNHNTGYPCISDDGSHLYFCTDDPEGLGGFDIYVSTQKNGRWSKPENLGPQVNTSKNEVFPFIHNNGRLYFASRGYTQRGDLNIYSTVKQGNIWNRPVPLPAPFNSPDNDYGIIFNHSFDTAYFVSDRNGSADIYLAASTLPAFSGCAEQKENDYCFVFYESNNSEIDTTAFAYEWDMGDGTKIRALEAEHCFAGPGNYLVQLNIVDKLTKDVLLSQTAYDFVIEKIEQPYITAPDTVYTGEPMQLHGRDTYLKDFTLEEYYWELGEGSRYKGAEVTHTYFVPGTYHITLGVTGKRSEANDAGEKYCVIRKIVVLEQKK